METSDLFQNCKMFFKKSQSTDLERICNLINSTTGLFFDDAIRPLVERKLLERLQRLKLSDFSSYIEYIQEDPNGAQELQEAIELLVNNETYFFREEYQLKAFYNEILPELFDRLKKNGRRRMLVWSAGCSTGEEVYTIAMLILRSGLFDGWNVRVFGNDISKKAIQIARRAVYSKNSFRAMPPGYDCFFETDQSMAQGFKKVAAPVREICQFAHFNILDRNRSLLLGKVDVIFCRNVLIYLDPESRKKAIEIFYDRLAPGGYLLLGHSESLAHASTNFELVSLSTDLVYRRPLNDK